MLRARAAPEIHISEMPSLDATELSTNSTQATTLPHLTYQTTGLDKTGQAIVMANCEIHGDLKPNLRCSIYVDDDHRMAL